MSVFMLLVVVFFICFFLCVERVLFMMSEGYYKTKWLPIWGLPSPVRPLVY